MNANTATPLDAIRQFLKLEAASGILLVLAGALAMIAANSPLVELYNGLLDIPFKVQLGSLKLDKPLLLWINDGLMAVFFLLVGLEIKREVVMGELSDRAKVALPAIGALGGMIVPALIYVYFNQGDPAGLRGWAIPTATDIAFALGVLSLLGERVPVGLKIFVMTLAVLDDLGAIVIIALFYTYELSVLSLGLAGLALATLVLMNRLGVMRVAAYAIVGALLWVFVLKSGVHATLAGVATALLIPARDPRRPGHPPLATLEHALHPWVAYGILPVFAFANAGVNLAGLAPRDMLGPVPLGVALGLLVGKPLGVFVLARLSVKAGVAKLPEGVDWRQLFGAAMLCGIGFTMSLFIGTLAFASAGAEAVATDRLGILAGSLLSALAGYLWLNHVLPRAGR